MNRITIKELVNATNGTQILGNLNTTINEVCIDSRKATKDSVYISIIGENLDGHLFIDSAYENGCRTFIISNSSIVLPFKDDVINVIVVEDTTLALGSIARYYKETFNIPYIGVTGSVGKTTTRDMIHSALSGKLNTHKNVGNLNNHIGVPLTLFKLNDNHESAVIEMGMSHFDEIAYLADMVNPQIGVISNVGLSHIENLGSREGVLKAKLEITKNFDKNNTLIINGDDEMLSTLKNKNLNYKLKTFGFDKSNDLYCEDFKISRNSIEFTCLIDNNLETFFVPTTGQHNILNAMSAILVGLELNLTLDEIKNGLKTYTATGMRLDIVDTDKYTIINDCYNASPDSMDSSLKVLSTFNTRKVAILGDMFEMGSFAEEGHRSVGNSAINNADILITIGKDSVFINEEAVNLGFDKNNAYHFDTKEALLKRIDDILKDNDTILVKASRGMKLEDIVENLMAK